MNPDLFKAIRRRLTILKWMVAVNLALVLILLVVVCHGDL